MNPRWKENPVLLQFLLGLLLFLFLSVLSYLLGLLQPSLSRLTLFARSNSTRTAIALTSQALMGPFPTATGPTVTASWTPSTTSTPTVTPTHTPTRTPVRYFINTSTPRTLVPAVGQTATSAAPTQARPSPSSVPPTQQPRASSTPVPQATDTPPPDPTREPKSTKAPKPTKQPKSTKTPKKSPLMRDCLYAEGCYEIPMDHAARLAYEYPEMPGFTRGYRE